MTPTLEARAREMAERLRLWAGHGGGSPDTCREAAALLEELAPPLDRIETHVDGSLVLCLRDSTTLRASLVGEVVRLANMAIGGIPCWPIASTPTVVEALQRLAGEGNADAVPSWRFPRLLSALKGMVGLTELILKRADLSPEVADALRNNHRVIEARAVIEGEECGQW